MEDSILTVEQVAQILQVHPFTVLKFIKQGKLKAAKLGRVYRIRRSEVDKFIDQQVERKDAAPAEKQEGKKKHTGTRTPPSAKKVSKDKEISPDSSLTTESKEEALQEETDSQKDKEVTMETTQITKQGRNQEDHYVIDFTI